MASLLSSSQSGVQRVAVFGKTPKMGDFLRVAHGGAAGEALQQWVEQGLELAEARRGASWNASYAAGETYAFIFRPPRSTNSREALVGVIKPSRDSVGRRFPLVIYAQALPKTSVPWPHVLPMAYGDFLDAAATLLLNSDNVTGIADMQAALSHVAAPHVGDADRCAQEYEMWAASTLLDHAWAVVYGQTSALSAPRALHTIVEAVAAFRGVEAPATKVGLRLPLGAGGIAAAAFWLDVLRRVSRTPSEARTCFWRFDGESGATIIQLGDTPAGTVGELWAPDPDSENLCDLTLPASVDVGRFMSHLPPHLVEVLGAREARVKDLLDRLAL